MKSKDPTVVANATQRADLFLQNTERKPTFNADGLRVKTNKTIINKKASESNPMQNDAMSPGKRTGTLILIIILKHNCSHLTKGSFNLCQLQIRKRNY
jgi:hypothetical protein